MRGRGDGFPKSYRGVTKGYELKPALIQSKKNEAFRIINSAELPFNRGQIEEINSLRNVKDLSHLQYELLSSSKYGRLIR